ncbi:uncharacterized protein LOC135226886 [Macrobrachium nipponense]|uniref:uncharacterized protein LOC135226886 n=1 Tax=Macrobrachium nipponense TaxID=159736 RepID=UPI0030C7DF6B
MESVLARVVVMIVVGVIGGAVAILFVRAESEQRKAASASAGGGGSPQERPLEDDQSLDNRSISGGNGKVDEIPEVPGISAKADSDISYLRQQLPQSLDQSEKRIRTPSQTADDVLADSGFLDELLLAIRRKLLSFPEEDFEDGKEVGRNLRRKKRYDMDAIPEELSLGEEWNEIGKTESVDDDATWQRSGNAPHHHIRHSRRKSHHRRYKTTPSEGMHQTAIGRQGLPEELEFQPEAAHPTARLVAPSVVKPSEENSVPGAKRVNSQFDNLTNVIIMGNITHLRTPHDIIEDDDLMAAEIREALLLAVPLSLLLTVILLICVAFCCCRYRNHPAYSEHMAYAAYREDEDYVEECPTVSTGMCDVCLPDISYQAHLATKIKKKKSRQRRASDQIELVLGGEAMDCDACDEGLKCHPPLYTLLSNLPPGSSLLEDDYRRESPFDSFRPSLPRRSQSLEFLTV